MARKETKTPKVGWVMAAVLAREYMKAGHNIMFTGMPGIGKTELIKMICNQQKWDLIIFHPVVSDPTDFKGMPWLYKDDKGNGQAEFVPFSELKLLMDATRPTKVFFDDLGQAPDAVQAAAMQVVHGGSIAGKKISKHVSFVACTNRKQDRAGVSGILEPLKSRFHGIWELEPELEPWIDYEIQQGMSPMLVAFMRRWPAWLVGGDEGWKPEPDIVNQPCPRTIEHLSDSINMNLPKELRPTAYAGAVGQAMANVYFAFEQLLVRMPDLDVVCKNPRGAEAPSSPDIMYAMIGALHARMDRGNLDNIYFYTEKHFPLEMQAVFHFDIKKFKPNLIQHQAHIAFNKKHGDLFTN
jgi:hypothetical protein